MNMTAILSIAVVLVVLAVLWLNRPVQVSDASMDAFNAPMPSEANIAGIHAEHRAQDEKMTHEQIMERALNDLQVKTSVHASVWKLGEEERWDWDGDKATLIFTFKGALALNWWAPMSIRADPGYGRGPIRRYQKTQSQMLRLSLLT